VFFPVYFYEDVDVKENNNNNRLLQMGIFLAAALVFGQTAHATTHTNVYIEGRDDNYAGIFIEPGFSNGGYGLTSVSDRIYQASGLNYQGNPDTMTLTWGGNAEVSASSLKASVYGSVDNLFYNPANNNFPVTFDLHAYSQLSQTLSITGAADISHIQVVLDVHGTMSASAFPYVGTTFNLGYSYGSLSVDPDDIISEVYDIHNGYFGWTDYIDTTLIALGIPVVNGQAQLDIWLGTKLSLSASGGGTDEPSGAPEFLEGAVDFFNTINIIQFQGVNAAGELVDLSSVTGSDGYIYDVLRVTTNSEIPEPSVIILLGAGLIGFGFVRHRNSLA